MSQYSIRIISLDSYMNAPISGLDVMYSDFRGSSVNLVPILRLFGSTATGEKICVHIHGVFPYLYIPYDGIEEANSRMYQIAAKIDKAVNISLNQTMSNTQHVYKINLVSGIPMYGYHTKCHQFFKISLYNPLLIRKVSSLLLNDATLGKVYQPHESHLNFTLQFMIDYNLHGMNNLVVSDMKFRINPNSIHPNIDSDSYLPLDVNKISICELEGDVLAEHIINRQEIASGNIAVNPGLTGLWADEMQRRRNKGEFSQIGSFLELKRNNLPPTETHTLIKQALTEKLSVWSSENVADKLSDSVYPAETPDGINIQNASFIDSNTPSSCDLSLDNSILTSDNFNDTLIATQQSNFNMNVSMDADALNLLEILKELRENAKENVDDDSILTQVVKDDDDERELDLSMPLESVTTPTKMCLRSDNSDSEDELDKTLIPQLDGENDDTDNVQSTVSSKSKKKVKFENLQHVDERGKKYLKKRFYVNIVQRCSRDMPLLDDTECISNNDGQCNKPVENNVKIVKFKELFVEVIRNKTVSNSSITDSGLNSSQNKRNKNTKILHTKKGKTCIIKKKTKLQNNVAKLMQTINEQDKKIMALLSKNSKPMFRIVAGRRLGTPPNCQNIDYKKLTKVQILGDIMMKIATYEIPSIHVLVDYPNKEQFIFKYNRNSIFPNVVRLTEKDGKCKKNLQEQVRKTKRKCGNVVDKYTRNVNNVYMKSKLKYNFGLKDIAEIVQGQLLEHMKILRTSMTSFNYIKKSSRNMKLIVQLERMEVNNVDESKKYLLNNNNSEIIDKNKLVETSTSSWAKKISKEQYKLGYLGADGTHDTSSSDEEHLEKRELSNKVPERAVPRRSLRISVKQSDKNHVALTADDAKTKIPRKRTSAVAVSPRYSALPISISSPKSSKPPANSVEVSIEMNEKAKEAKKSVNVTKTTFAPCDINVKRKLDFSISHLHSTVIEENLICTFSPSSRSKTVDVRKKSVHSDLTPGCSAAHVLFSSDSENEQNNSSAHLPVVDNILTSERYDKENNYQAKEGSSKMFTPQTIEDSKSSREVEELHSSSEGSTSGMLTPYQPQRSQTSLSIIKEDDNEEIASSGEEFGSQRPENINSSVTDHTANNPNGLVVIVPSRSAPTKQEVLRSLDNLKIPHVKQAEPFYSNSEDVTGGVEVGFNVLKINGQTTAHLTEFHSHNDALNTFRNAKLEMYPVGIQKSSMNHKLLSHCEQGNVIITPLRKPPTLHVVKDWLSNKIKVTSLETSSPLKCQTPKLRIVPSPSGDEDMEISLTLSPTTPKTSQTQSRGTSESSGNPSSPVLSRACKRRKQEILNKKLLESTLNSSTRSCQITGVIVNNTFGFDNSIENLQNARTVSEHQNLTLLVMELHLRTRSDFKPDPAYDSIRSIFYSVANDVAEDNPKPTKSRGIVVINSLPLSPGTSKFPILNGIGVDCDVTYTDSEEKLIDEFLKIVNYWNPDMIAGYEIEMLSWGYLIDRSYTLGLNIKPLLDRSKVKSFRDNESSQDLQIVGRIVLDVWRLMRHEIALQSYTFESIVYHILHRRVAHYSFKDLSFWWDHRSNIFRHRTVSYYLTRVGGVLELLDKLDFIGRTSELARLFGIQFYEVLSRGTQFRVESMMLRLAKPLNFIPVSPSVQQRAHMKAPEYIPLILEPESKLYNDPVIVLDFQSLYPSIIIAYNYCFTTCLGKVDKLGKNVPFEFGSTQLRVPRKLLEKLLRRDLVNFSPCRVGFVKKKVRDGILPRMLREILDTRLMVKNSMKENKGNSVLQKVLHSRQLGLKLIANVTYGYTSANFSGRMPSVEVGDSVVSKGRETLQRAIELVENTPEWGAKVVYGDTDSLFVMVPGRTRAYAFEIGKKIADAVTASNPDPIKLKLEKVYQPCILQTKKRYVGYMYESADQKEPVYEAKGIETVRRDGCPAVSKMLEKCLRILFQTKDVSLVKKYVVRQFNKIQAGRASIQDLTFAKEYRGAAGYRPTACVPALELTKKWTAVDKRNEPRSGQRVPYVIVNGPPGLPLIRLVRSPTELLNDPALRPNALYYITRVIIPPINRCFNLIGADLHTWYSQMPRKQTRYLPSSISPEKKSTISQYFATTSCVSCREQTQVGICGKCCDRPQMTTVTLMEKLRIWERNNQNCVLICQTCTSTQTEIKCVSLDCPVLYRRIQTNRDLQQATYIRQLLNSSEFLF